jgi:hypothetical protein
VLIAIAFPSFRLLYLMDLNLILNLTQINIMNSIIVTSLNTNFIKSKKAKRISDKNIIKIYSDCTAIVPFKASNLGFSIGIRLNQFCRNNTFLFSSLKDQIIGHLLGDGCIYYTRTAINPLFHFSQTIRKFEYL